MAQILPHTSFLKNDVEQRTSSKKDEVIKLFEETHQFVKPRIADAIKQFENDPTHEMLVHGLNTKSHYDRAWALRFGTEIANGCWQDNGDLMVALELSYASIVILDDIMDKGELRLGKPSLHKAYGIEKALCAASILKSLSVQIMIGFLKKSDSLKLTNVLELLQETEAVHSNIYLGQYIDLKWSERSIDELSIEDYLEMINLTTGIDLGFCCKLGFLSNCNNELQANSVHDFGLCLGNAMQIRDDFLDYKVSSDEINKSNLLDIKNGRKRLPLIIIFMFSQETTVKNKLKEVYSKKSLDSTDIRFLRKQVYSEQVLNIAVSILKQLREKAYRSLKKANTQKHHLDLAMAIFDNILIR